MEVDHDEQASKYTEEKQERNKRMLSESPESSNTIQVPKGPPKGKKKVKLGLEKAASSGNLLSYLKKRNKENNEEEGHSSFICEQDSAPLVVRPVYMISGIREPPHAVFSAETWHHCWSVAGQTNLDESSASSSCRNSDTSHLPEAVL
ncbi:hypothetical protein M8J75_001319 [Diaphorina citri]|nr:hypothetical protein M8J75_001319 [Diaphorina citri]